MQRFIPAAGARIDLNQAVQRGQIIGVVLQLRGVQPSEGVEAVGIEQRLLVELLGPRIAGTLLFQTPEGLERTIDGLLVLSRLCSGHHQLPTREPLIERDDRQRVELLSR